jgi:putative Holliday junction resolvase
MEKELRILGIDFGLKRIGLALSDPLKIFAYPFKTIENDNKVWENLKNIIKENSIEKIILGYPLRFSREETHVTQAVLDFKNILINKFNIEVILWDETLTSQIAKKRVLESVNKKSQRRRRGIIDMNSALVILQEFLEKKSSF